MALLFCEESQNLTTAPNAGQSVALNQGESGTVTTPSNQSTESSRSDDTQQLTHISLPAEALAANSAPADLESTADVDNDETIVGMSDGKSAAPVAPIMPVDSKVDQQIGRYQITKELGRGGMGVVYQATDPDSNTTVAIKMLTAFAAADPTARMRFEKEARLLAEVNNPWVTNLLDVGEHDDIPFLVIEYVDGTDLSHELKNGRRFNEKQALSLIADVARALVPAHDLGIIHRDIKPGNILLTKQAEDSNKGTAEPDSQEIEFRVRLADFGLARHQDQSQSMQMTQTGAFMGTPTYMSPEQYKGTGEITPETDVYSLGVTLYELLAGVAPFIANDPMQLAAKHCFDNVPDLTKKNAAVSDATIRIVNKALAKEATARYADAAQLLADIQQLLTGNANAIAQHPALSKDEDSAQHTEFVWELNSPPEKLWPFVSDTERVNEALGLPAVKFTGQQTPTGLKRTGSFQLAGMTIEWEEHPFEWIEGRRFGVFREFSKGPFRWFSSAVNMELTANGGTRLTHTIRICPRNFMGRLVAALEIKVKAKKSLDKVYRRIDQIISEKTNRAHLDPFRSAKPLSSTQKSRLTQRLQKLESGSASLEVAEQLRQLLTLAPQQVVSRIRPLEFARTNGLDPQLTTHCFLHAAACQILQIQWDILCPTCRIASDAVSTMDALKNHAYCEACDADFEVDLASVIELVFRAHPEIRDTAQATYCIGGPGHSPHVVAQVTLQPDERFELTTQLDAGEYVLRGPRLPFTLLLNIDSQRGVPRAEIHLRITDESPRLPLIRAGSQLLTWVNHEQTSLQIRLERTIPRSDVVTAAQAILTPAFLELFPNEVPDPNRAFTTAEFTICVLRFPGLPSVTERLGDLKACELWTATQRQLRRDVAAAAGVVVCSSTSEVLITFLTLDSALGCLQSLMQNFSSEPAGPPAAAINRGAVVATNTNGRLDYFGHIIDEARTLLSTTEAGHLAAPNHNRQNGDQQGVSLRNNNVQNNDLQNDDAIQSLLKNVPESSIKRSDQAMRIKLTRN